jgi:hypothetical protein
MIPTYLLGRYECIDPEINARRVWHIVHDQTRDVYIVSYGRINGHATNIEYNEKQARIKIAGKRKDTSKRPAYVKREGYEEVIGSLAINFICSLVDE